MTFQLVLCIGQPAHVSSMRVFTRAAAAPDAFSRGDLMLCPVTPAATVPVSVAELRLGGPSPIAVVHSDEPADGDLVAAVANDPAWMEVPTASGLRGAVVGVFIDRDGDDLILLDDWPQWSSSHAAAMAGAGLLGVLPAFRVFGLPDPVAGSRASAEQTAQVVPMFRASGPSRVPSPASRAPADSGTVIHMDAWRDRATSTGREPGSGRDRHHPVR